MSDAHLAEVHAAEELVEQVERTREQLRAEARVRIGITGRKSTVPMRETISRHGLSWYPMVALGSLAIVDRFQGYGFAVLAPEISNTLGIGKGVIGGVLALKTLALSLAPLPVAALVQRSSRRGLLSVVAAIVWSLTAISTGFVVATLGLVVVLLIDGFTTGSVTALHRPLLLDSYPPEGRIRALSYYQAAESTGNVLAPLLVAVFAGAVGLTWRGVFVILGGFSLLGALSAIRLRDPGVGRWDADRIRQAVRERHGEEADTTSESPDVSLRFFEIVHRLLLIPTVRRLLAGYAVFGILLIPLQTFVFFFLEERWGLSPGERGMFFAYTAAVGVVALAVFARRGEAAFGEDPGRLLRFGGALLAGTVVFVAAAGLAPWFWLVVVLFGIAFGMLGLVNPALAGPLLSVVSPVMRPHAAALTGVFLGGVGGIVGALFLSGIDRRFGVAGSLVALLLPGLVGGALVAAAGKSVTADLDRMIDEVVEDEEIARVTASGGHLPMLACRNVQFSYGALQVLFGVDFTVDDGEMVALLGVNGAGKSTLLKAISGICLPSTGRVRFRGADITYLDAERRLRLGITQIPGGRAVFGPVSVVDNLRGFAYTLGRDKRRMEERLDRCFEAFPRLAERRNQAASTLSGGEQQMLAMSKALLLQPRLLLIDELSLGLAPIVVGQLLDMVRRINADGTAVVLVEQSANIALGLVQHAYFMEKGAIRFDGRSEDLLARDDLLRAVFLEGVGTRR